MFTKVLGYPYRDVPGTRYPPGYPKKMIIPGTGYRVRRGSRATPGSTAGRAMALHVRTCRYLPGYRAGARVHVYPGRNPSKGWPVTRIPGYPGTREDRKSDPAREPILKL